MLPFPESEQLTIGENVLSLTTLPILSRISYQLLFEISYSLHSHAHTLFSRIHTAGFPAVWKTFREQRKNRLNRLLYIWHMGTLH